MTDWNKCPAVESVPGKVSGNWVFTGTRLPLYTLFENLAEGATIYDFIDWFEGVEEKELENEGFKAVYFNAWEDDFATTLSSRYLVRCLSPSRRTAFRI